MRVATGAPISEDDLKCFSLLEGFLKDLDAVASKRQLHPTFSDPTRELSHRAYLSLFLFGLFNPVVESMRALCAITAFEKVQKTVGCRQVSLGSFSECQHVLDPDILKEVVERLSERIQPVEGQDARFKAFNPIAQDGSLWSALPRMAWAEYGVGAKGEANGVRMHLRLNILKACPEDALIQKGKSNEREALREMLLPGQTNVCDRLYGKDYKLLKRIHECGAFYVFRASEHAVVQVEKELPLTEADREAGVVKDSWVSLGATEKLRTEPMRLVEVKKDGQHLFLITNHLEDKLPAELVSLLYRQRWSIELFFRWVKCVLGCRHFFAESEKGVAIQLYLALIAALLLQQFTGKRPSRRTMESLQFLQLGWATPEEVLKVMLKEANRKAKSRA